MVRIINYSARQAENKVFYILELQGGVEMVKSQNSGQYYVTAKKASISTTFDKETCKALIGTEMPGNIRREECEPYEYTIKDTGEVILLGHRNVFVPEVETLEKQGQSLQPVEYSFSKNGVLEEEMAI